MNVHSVVAALSRIRADLVSRHRGSRRRDTTRRPVARGASTAAGGIYRARAPTRSRGRAAGVRRPPHSTPPPCQTGAPAAPLGCRTITVIGLKASSRAVMVQRAGPGDIAQKSRSSRRDAEPCDKTWHRCLTNDCLLASGAKNFASTVATPSAFKRRCLPAPVSTYLFRLFVFSWRANGYSVVERALAPAREDAVAVENRHAQEHQQQPDAYQSKTEQGQHRGRQPERAGELRDQDHRERNDDEDAELLRRARVVDARRDDDGRLQRHERGGRPPPDRENGSTQTQPA